MNWMTLRPGCLLWIELNVPEAILQLEQLQKEVPAKRANDSCGDCRWNQRRKYPIWPWIRSHWEKDYLPKYKWPDPSHKWRPTFMISKHCMFAGFIKEIFLTFDNQIKAIKWWPRSPPRRFYGVIKLWDQICLPLPPPQLWGLLKRSSLPISGFRHQRHVQKRCNSGANVHNRC